MDTPIRAPRPEDYPALAHIHNDQNEPDFHTTGERLRDADGRRAAASPRYRRLVLAEAGEPVATLTWHPDFGDEARGDVRWTYPYVRRDRVGGTTSPLKTTAQQAGTPLSLLVDQINEKALEILGDTLIDTGGEGLELIEEHADALAPLGQASPPA